MKIIFNKVNGLFSLKMVLLSQECLIKVLDKENGWNPVKMKCVKECTTRENERVCGHKLLDQRNNILIIKMV